MMATAKKSVAKKAPGLALISKKHPGAAVAIEWAVKALKDPAIRPFLLAVPSTVAEWAAKVKKPDLKPHFGQKGLEYRARELRQAVQAVFPDPALDARVKVEQALDGVDRMLAAAGRLPLMKRKKLHWKVDNSLDDLEHGLVAAFDDVHPG